MKSKQIGILKKIAQAVTLAYAPIGITLGVFNLTSAAKVCSAEQDAILKNNGYYEANQVYQETIVCEANEKYINHEISKKELCKLIDEVDMLDSYEYLKETHPQALTSYDEADIFNLDNFFSNRLFITNVGRICLLRRFKKQTNRWRNKRNI